MTLALDGRAACAGCAELRLRFREICVRRVVTGLQIGVVDVDGIVFFRHFFHRSGHRLLAQNAPSQAIAPGTDGHWQSLTKRVVANETQVKFHDLGL